MKIIRFFIKSLKLLRNIAGSKYCTNKDGKIDANDLSFLEQIIRDANQNDNTLIQLLIQNWLPTTCDPIEWSYCGDGVCQPSEKDKYGNPICTLDCKGPVKPDTPKTGWWDKGASKWGELK